MEALAATTWMQTFGEKLSGWDVLILIDSQAAEGAVASGYASSKSLTAIAGKLWITAANSQIRAWIVRVPSKLNRAD